MEKKTVFQILGISETKDKEAIQLAYRTNLIKVNPEDDPEGFKRLREAYEEAIRLINVEEEEDVPETEIDFWILKVKEVYGKLSTRINKVSWECLFKEDLCQDLEMEDEVRDALLVFLMDSYRLPGEIWALIEETFQIERDKEALYEKFPPNFIDYVIRSIHLPDWEEYTLFEGEDEADYDTFIQYCFDIHEEINNQEGGEDKEEVIKGLFEQIEQTNIWHPYIDLEKLRYYLVCNKMDEADRLGDKLKQYEEDTYIGYHLSSLAWKKGNFEEAYQLCMDILEKEPEYFSARVRVCDYYLEIGEYEKARDGYSDLMSIAPNNQRLEDAYFKANSHLITLYKEKLGENPNDDEVKIELGWCLFQNNFYEECLELLETIQIGEAVSSYQYYNLKARLYYYMEDFEKAIPNLEIWIEEILKVEDDGSEEATKKLKRLPFAYYALANSYAHKENFDKALTYKALTYIEKALEVSKKERETLECLLKKAFFLLKMERYEDCVDVCDQIINQDAGCFPAYVYRQEAYYKLRRAQGVIDDFYNAIEIVPGYAKPYVLATRVFYIFGQYEDAKNIIERAHSAEVESYKLELLELQIKMGEAETQEEQAAVEKELGLLVEKAKEDLKDLENLSEVLREQAIYHIRVNNHERALELAEQALVEEESYDSLQLKADVLYNLTRYSEALNIYKKIEKEVPDHDSLKCDIGDCFTKLGMEHLALQYYMDALEIEPESSRACYKLMEIYKAKYERNYDLEDYKKVVAYGKKLFELDPSADAHNLLGLFCLEGENAEGAIAIFEEIIEKYPDYIWAHNNLGWTHKILGNYEEAYKSFEKGIEIIGAMRTKNPAFEYLGSYWNLARICRTTKNYEKAIEIYQHLIETYEQVIDDAERFEEGITELASTYEYMGEWEKAIEQYKRLEDVTIDMEYLQKIGKCLAFLGRHKEAEAYLKKAIKQAPKESNAFMQLGEYYWYVLGNEKKALEYYDKARKASIKNEYIGYIDIMAGFLELMKNVGKGDKCKKYKKEIEKYIEIKYGSVEGWLANPASRKARLYCIGMWYYVTGDYQKVREYIEKVKKTRTCNSCDYCECIELYDLEALLLIEEGQYEKALAIYEKLIMHDPSELRYFYRKRELEKKVKGMKK